MRYIIPYPVSPFLHMIRNLTVEEMDDAPPLVNKWAKKIDREGLHAT
jgi:hypothetical protein